MALQSSSLFDAVIVGARVAGSAAAIMLGRQGKRVLLLDKNAFPSDTLSTHVVLGGGARVLERMGVMSELEHLGGHRLVKTRMRMGELEFTGISHSPEGTAGLCLGRARMDAAMLEFARAIESVTVRERLRVTGLLIENGAVRGVRGIGDAGIEEFRAPLTIGADGMRSVVARAANESVGAFAPIEVPCARAYYYGYFTDVAEGRLENMMHIALGPRDLGYVAARCEDRRTVAATAFDAARMPSFRADLAANFLAQIEQNREFAACFEGASFAGKVYSSGLLRNTYRIPVCDGALLLGDAGLHADPIFGQGHSLALISAEIMADLARQWFAARDGEVIEAAAMSNFTQRRDALLKPHYDATVETSRRLEVGQIAAIAWRAAAAEQWAADEFARFVNMLSGPGEFPSFRFARLMAKHAS